MKRRDFIKDSAILVAAAGAGNALKAAERSFAPIRMTEDGMTGHDGNATDGDGKLITSAPMLQNYAEDSIGVAFAVGALANGYVLIGEKPDLSDARKIKCGGYRLTEISDKVSQIRVTGLKPSTKYFYKIGADRIVLRRHIQQSLERLIARVLEGAGGAKVFLEGEFDAESLLREIDRLLQSPEELEHMSKAMASLSVPDATDKIVDKILQLARK